MEAAECRALLAPALLPAHSPELARRQAPQRTALPPLTASRSASRPASALRVPQRAQMPACSASSPERMFSCQSSRTRTIPVRVP